MSRNNSGAAGGELPQQPNDRDSLPRQTIYDAANGIVADVYVVNDPLSVINNNVVPMDEDNDDTTNLGQNDIDYNQDVAIRNLVSSILGTGGIDGGRGDSLRKCFGSGGGGGGPSGGSGGGGGGGGGGGDDPLGSATLDDVGGLDEQVAWLRQSVLCHLKGDSKLSAFGMAPPKGILFHGPPGTGKTLLARAFGNELNKLTGKKVTFFHRRGPDVYSPWFGESSRQLREIFAKAVRMKPSIIFFDELDGLCPSRERAIGNASSTVVTTLLGCMDTLPPGDVFVFGASNLVDSIDPAMRRPGRFDKHLEFFPPSLEGRKTILGIQTKKWKRSHPSQEKIAELAERTLGFTGADLEKLTRETFFSALERTVPAIIRQSGGDEDEDEDDDMDLDSEEMEITDDDWDSALRRVRPSPAVFDSALFVPRIPHARVNPLVRRTQEHILDQLLQTLPRDNQQAKEDENGNDPLVYVVKSLIIIDKETIPLDTVGTYVLPGVFAHQEVSLLPVYLLSAQRLHASPCGPLLFLERTLTTVVNRGKPCILYIPMIDKLLLELPAMFLPLAHGLQLLNTQKVLLIASSSTESTDLPEQLNFRNLFSGIFSTVYSVDPTQAETREFLKPVFQDARNKMKENATGIANVNNLLAKATLKLNGATIKEHLNFHDGLDAIIKEERDTGVMMQKLERCVDGFILR